ncbi:MAG: ParB/RepB/Spo0J family partition protein [Proteobacteria bacterium]|nr:ParB/RepB/Spo0J family partition protein [Pseudomonadota bacterium]
MKETAQQEKKLGRGLSALLGESKSKKIDDFENEFGSAVDSIKLVPVEKITAGIYQPRKTFDEVELNELSKSIKENGLIQPIILRKSDEEDNYEIIAGERRFRAAKIAGLSAIPAIIKKINNHEALELAIIENVQRTDLSLIEEAEGYKQLIQEFSYTQDQIAKRVGKSRSHITNLLRLLTLPQVVRNFLDQKLISMGHARAIINSNSPEKIAQKIVKDSLSVRDVEDLVRNERVEKAQTTPVLIRTESKIKFFNSDYLVKLENELSEVIGMESKISYNSFKNSGKILIKFSELNKIQQLIEKIKMINSSSLGKG